MTDRYAVFGDPIDHSLSPQIHRLFATETGQDISYVAQRVAAGKLAEAAKHFFTAGGKGLNITLPLKTEAYDFADRLTERAQLAGAVNTLALQPDGTILGDNTDGVGLVRALEEICGWPLQDQRLLILGAGGAARGVIAPLLQAKVRSICIANRTAKKAQQLASDFAALSNNLTGIDTVELAHQKKPFDLIINATSAALSGGALTLPDQIIAPQTRAYDMGYATQPTAFMRRASQQAATAADGTSMLVCQAAESFHLWRNKRPSVVSTIATLRSDSVQSKANQTQPQARQH